MRGPQQRRVGLIECSRNVELVVTQASRGRQRLQVCLDVLVDQRRDEFVLVLLEEAMTQDPCPQQSFESVPGRAVYGLALIDLWRDGRHGQSDQDRRAT